MKKTRFNEYEYDILEYENSFASLWKQNSNWFLNNINGYYYKYLPVQLTDIPYNFDPTEAGFGEFYFPDDIWRAIE